MDLHFYSPFPFYRPLPENSHTQIYILMAEAAKQGSSCSSGAFGVQYLAQGQFRIQLGGVGIRTSNRPTFVQGTDDPLCLLSYSYPLLQKHCLFLPTPKMSHARFYARFQVWWKIVLGQKLCSLTVCMYVSFRSLCCWTFFNGKIIRLILNAAPSRVRNFVEWKWIASGYYHVWVIPNVSLFYNILYTERHLVFSIVVVLCEPYRLIQPNALRTAFTNPTYGNSESHLHWLSD